MATNIRFSLSHHFALETIHMLLKDKVAVITGGAGLNGLGFAIIRVFFLAWLVSYAIYKAKKLDAFEIARSGPV